MALTEFVTWVNAEFMAGGGSSLTSHAMSGDGHRVGMVLDLCVPHTGTLRNIHFKLAAMSGASNSVRVSIQGVDGGTGNPNGTPVAYRDVALVGTDDNLMKSTGILSDDGTDTGAKPSVTKGGSLAIVWEFVNAWTTENYNYAMVTLAAAGGPVSGGLYALQHNGSAWTKNAISLMMIVLEYDDGTVHPLPFVPGFGSLSDGTSGSGFTNESIDVDTTPDEIALYIRFPFRCTVDAAIVCADMDDAATTVGFQFLIYDSDGTTALLAAITKDGTNTSGTSGRGVPFVFGAVTFEANTYYRATAKATGASGDLLGVKVMEVGAAAHFDQAPLGSDCHYSSRANAGSWTEVTTKRPLIALRINQIDTGGGGSLIGPGSRIR